MMDNNNWRPTPTGGVGGGVTEAALDGGDWRAQLLPESRERIVNKIMETLKRHLPVSGPEGLQELRKIAVRFEEKIYTAAANQSDYLRKVSLKMLTMETKSQSTIPNALPSHPAGNSTKDSVMQSQIQSQSQPIPNSLAVNQPQARQQLLVPNIQNNVPSGVQASASLSSTLQSVSGLNQSPLPNTIGQNNNMQNMPSVSQNSLGNSMGQGLNSNMFANSQRQMQARQQQHELSSLQMMQQNQLAGQQNNIGDMHQQQQQQQQKRLLNQQNNLQNLQQQQQLMPQENNLTNVHTQQMSPQANVSGLNQQQQLVGSQSGNSSMQVGQHPFHVLQQSKVPVQQQMQGGTSNVLASQGQQSQAQPMQQQLMSQVQQQPAQLQQQVGLHEQANLLQQDMHQRLQASGSLVQQQNVIDQQKQLYPSQKPFSETSALSIDSSAQVGHSAGGDWKEEAYQKPNLTWHFHMEEKQKVYCKWQGLIGFYLSICGTMLGCLLLLLAMVDVVQIKLGWLSRHSKFTFTTACVMVGIIALSLLIFFAVTKGLRIAAKQMKKNKGKQDTEGKTVLLVPEIA